jgi:hypothetical protein
MVLDQSAWLAPSASRSVIMIIGHPPAIRDSLQAASRSNDGGGD